MSISETCSAVGSNPIIAEIQLTSSELSSSQKDGVLLNAHEIVAVPTHEETENESSSIMKTFESYGFHHFTTKVSDEYTYRDSLVVLLDMSYLNESYVFDQISYKNEKKYVECIK
ncbi:hypothetical protein MS3_00000611 [Schistosoma haematobium]|uniref:Uncharacterized protein n=1 Tax=Schistosoma haematobium TaxID=6185 RepID=A0A922LFV8_SCHHA|nr:hypothetical protein MS3_00000611 [Schistosoma haematobium]KAH9581574.1 hypothetical protein MS3_00000611 [Schistosoma haematobium]